MDIAAVPLFSGIFFFMFVVLEDNPLQKHNLKGVKRVILFRHKMV